MYRRRLALTATLVAGLMLGAAGALAATGQFDDVPADHTHASAVGWLADRGITKGCNPPINDEFCPDDAVTRAEMATFLKRFADSYSLDETGGGSGDTGPMGPAGPAGADGASAYEIAVAEGFTGTEAEWLASLEGPAGEDGFAGLTIEEDLTPVLLFDPDEDETLPVLSCPEGHVAINGGATFDAVFIGVGSFSSELVTTEGLPTGVEVIVIPDYDAFPFLDAIVKTWVLCVDTPA